jgi:hypothetical protein
MNQLEYSIFSWPAMDPLDAIEMHVLARAYWAAWRSLHARDPAGRHVIASLDVVIVFGNRPQPRSAARSAPG